MIHQKQIQMINNNQLPVTYNNIIWIIVRIIRIMLMIIWIII
jgi:hypothetical protein